MSQVLPKSVHNIQNSVVKELLQAVKRLQNGDISRIMNRMGLLYRYNFGVSIPQLRELAGKYNPDQEVSNLLFTQNIREAKILASIMSQPEKITQQQALDISSEIKNQELVEQFSRNVFSKLPFINQLLDIWITGDSWNKILTFYSIGWKFKTDTSDSNNLIDWLTEHYNVVSENDELLVQQSLGFAMQSISAKSDENKAKMTALAKNMMKSEKKSVRRIAEDFMWLNAI